MGNSADLSLYIHIPFCVQRCIYCDFYSVSGAGLPLIKTVLEKIYERTAARLDWLKPRAISTVFIGGGTPSLLNPEYLNSFLRRMNSLIGPVEEFSIESNPESLSSEFLSTISDNGVDRLSLGVQSYDDDLLRWLRRPAGSEALRRADELIAESWSGRLNRDLIAALPGSPGRLKRDIYRALNDDPGHISIYELTVEPGTPLAEDKDRLESLPSEEDRLVEWEGALECLEQNGYHRYEISNFAKKDQRCRHNENYWRLNPYLGVGPGAVSTVWSGSSALRCTDLRDLNRWLIDDAEVFDKDILNAPDFALEHFIMALRTAEGLSRKSFQGVFGRDPVELIPKTIDKWGSANLLLWDDDSIRLVGQGFEMTDAVLKDLMIELETHRFPEPYRWPSP